MNFEFQEQLHNLKEAINAFRDFAEEHHLESTNFEPESELEYDFLEDESGISNTEIENLVENLEHIYNTINRLIE